MIDLEVKSNLRTGFPRVELEIMRGRARNRIRRIDVPVYLIGSAADCDLVLADSGFPDVHTYLYVTKEGVSVRRLGEGPELAVDGQVMQASTIRNGQRLQLGSYEFTVHVGESAPRPDKSPVPTPKLPAIAELMATPPSSTLHLQPAGVAEVRCLLADIRATLQIETSLRLYIEPETNPKIHTPHIQPATRKATA
jgi:hypothetical protein